MPGDQSAPEPQGAPAEDGIRDLLRGLPVFAGPLPGFDPAAAPDDPAELFLEWFTAALREGVPEPHAMTVATADQAGAPSARVVIMKDFTQRGWWFATTTTSRKGRELAANPAAALLFHWGPQGRQVRVRGSVELASPEQCAADFLARPLESRVAGLHGRQSRPLADPAEVDRAADRGRELLEREPGLAPGDWGLYVVSPAEVEFWQADPDRRHMRLHYSRTGPDGSWERGLLWP
ncbi:pyridoxal 5'-phosphate synthase [Nocardiopsis tropica]|uniref:Pyridoxal 5'-phosphate synthase n=1 Tax=Nocardiopsis tropica TaxID=109330 RepID=A0ABU7L182_9ACTN|nr:pyridoxal 5'-phosphate synthase [Nocardiopsis umidischolae]MEE2055295.1 pyridoxal 5'-phosphate synthase [Nocardiopsis umidischolae]